MQKFEQWLQNTSRGGALWRSEGQLLRQIVARRAPKNVLQVGGLPLLDFSSHAKTHYIHQHRAMDFFSPAHSVCAADTQLPFRDDSINLMVCPHTHELYEGDDQVKLFSEMARVLQSEGILVMFGVNLLGVWTLRRLINSSSLLWGPNVCSVYHLQSLARNAGLVVVDVEYFFATQDRFLFGEYFLKAIQNSKGFKHLSTCYMLVLAHQNFAPVWADGVVCGDG